MVNGGKKSANFHETMPPVTGTGWPGFPRLDLGWHGFKKGRLEPQPASISIEPPLRKHLLKKL